MDSMIHTTTYTVSPPSRPSPNLPASEQFSSFPGKNLTPEKMVRYLEEAEQGNISAQSELMQDILERDPTIASAFETRSLAVQAKQWDIIPIEGTGKEGERQAEYIKGVANNLSSDYIHLPNGSRYITFEDMLSYISCAVPYGFAAVNLIWDIKESCIIAAIPIEHKYFTWGDQSKKGQVGFDPYELRIKTEKNRISGETIEPFQFLVHTRRNNPVKPGRRGMLRNLMWWWFFKNFAVKSMVRYAERTGEPLRIGKYDPTVINDQDIVRRAVRGLGTDAYAVVSKAAEIDFIGHDRSTSNDIHTRLITLVNSEISKVVLGHQSATEAEPGKLGNDEQKLEVQYYRIEADARAEQTTINTQFIAPIARFRDGKVLCRFKRYYEADEDITQRANRYVQLSSIPGFDIPISHLRSEFAIPEPVGDEPVTEQSFQNIAYSNTMQHKKTRVRTTARKRGQQAEQAMKDTMERSIVYSDQSKKIYRDLISHASYDTMNMHRVIRQNIGKFRDEFVLVMSRSMKHAGRLAMQAFGGLQTISNSISFDLPDDPAIRFLEYQAFTVTVLEGEKITIAMKDELSASLKEAMEKGWSLDTWHDEVLNRIGVGNVHDYHLNTIYRTNMMTAHSASKIFAMQRNIDTFPAWEYMAVMDNRTREDHAALDGKIFATNDERYMPPLGYNCRCIASPISQDEFNEENYTISGGRLGDDEVEDKKKFENNAVKNFLDWLYTEMIKYPEAQRLIMQYETENYSPF